MHKRSIVYLFISLLLSLVSQVSLAQQNIRDPKPSELGIKALGQSTAQQVAAACPSSPFTPPEANDSNFLVDCDSGLDTGCTFRSGGPLIFTIKIGRVIGDKTKLKENGLISETATLQLPAFDVDFNGGGGTFNPERDRVSFNGNVVPTEFLIGDNNVWRLNEFIIPIEWVNFADDPGPGGTPTPGNNVIRIDIDTANSDEVWCTSIDWAALSMDIARPVVMAHGILSSGSAWDQADFSWVRTFNDLGLPSSNRLNMGNLDSIQNNAQKIANEVANARQRWGVDKVNIVAHSKGGIDSRHFVEHSDSVERVIQLGTPNAGSPLADLAQGILVSTIGLPVTALVNVLAGPAGVQLTQPYMAIYNLLHGSNPQVEYTALAGDYDPDCFILNPFCRPLDRLLLLITGQGDTIVPVTSVHALSFTNNRFFASQGDDEDAKHTSLNHSSGVYGAVNDRVETFATASFAQALASLPVARTASFVNVIQQGQVQTHTVQIDQQTLTFFSMMYPSGNLNLTLISPSGIRIDASTVGGNPGVEHQEEDILGGIVELFSIETPEVGVWTVEVSAPLVTGSSGLVNFSVNAWIENPAITLEGKIANANVHLNEALDLLGVVKENGAPLLGATVTAKIALPNDTVVDVTLLDNGIGTDAVANDGIYTGQLTNTTLPGNYRISFVARRNAAPSVAGFSREDFALATVSNSSSAITGPFRDFGSDSDGNGFFNILVVELGLDITAQANYRVRGILKDANGKTLDASTEAILGVGSRTVALQFNGEEIFNNRVDGPYSLSLVRLAEESNFEILPVDEAMDVHQTAAYSFRAFEHSRIHLTGNGSATGVDTDSNGLFDRLDVIVQVEVTNSGSYQWSARLTDRNGTEIGFASRTGFFNSGTNNLTFTFAGKPIGQNGVDGPYFIRGLLVNGGGDSLVVSNAFATSPFLASQFEGFVARNHPPVAQCQNVTVPTAPGVCTASASVNNGSFDPDGDPITLTQSPAGPYSLGTTNVTLTVTDNNGASNSCAATVTVQDRTSPVISSVSANPSTLWPPNHKMVPVTVTVSASDNCGVAPVCKIISVSSNEPVDGLGDGDTAPDWDITGNLKVNLRAERSGSGNGRVYTLMIECTDASGNGSTKSVTVTVPHNR